METVAIVVQLPPHVLSRLLLYADRYPSIEKLIETAIEAYLIRVEEENPNE